MDDGLNSAFNRKTPLFIRRLIYEEIDLRTREVIARIYGVKYGAGDFERFLIVPGDIMLPAGINQLYVRPWTEKDGPQIDLNMPVRTAASMFKETHSGIKLPPKERGEKYESIEYLSAITGFHKTYPDCEVILTLDLPVKASEIEKMKKKDQDYFDALYHSYLTEGLEKDSNLIYILKGFLPFKYARYRTLSPGEVVQKAPHAVIFTNSKVSKSYTARKVGYVIEDYSPAGLFGFATADNSYKGALEGKSEAVFFDEVRDQTTEGILTKTKSYEESGIFRVAKGSQVIETHAYAPLVYMGNFEPEGKDLTDFVLEFEEIISKLTTSPGPFGTRKGIIYVTPNAHPKAGTPLPRGEIEEINARVDCILMIIGEVYEKILLEPDVERWFFQPHPDWYVKAIKETVQSSDYINKPFREFWLGQRDSYLHTKLFALNHAILDSTAEILRGEINTGRLLRRADTHLEELLHLNLSSLKTLINLAKGQDTVLFSRAMDDLKPEYLKALVAAFNWHVKDRADLKRGEVIAFKDISYSYPDLPKEKISDLFIQFRRIKEKIPKYLGGINSIAERRFGFIIFEEKGEYFIRIKDPILVYNNLPSFREWVRTGAEGCGDEKVRTKAHPPAPAGGSQNELSQFDRVKEVLLRLWELESQYGGAPVSYSELRTSLDSRFHEHLDEDLQHLKQEGAIFEPKSKLYKVIIQPTAGGGGNSAQL